MTEALLDTASQQHHEPVQDRPGVTYAIVTQAKSYRVVYFTDDPAYVPPMDGDWYYVSSYQGALPEGMTLRNCWGWRFNGGVFVDAREAPKMPQKESLLENNRKALLRILEEKIDVIREPYLPTCQYGEAIRAAKLAEARDYMERSESRDAYPLLEAVAVARNMSVLEAASLVAARAEETEKMLIETERFREQFSQAVQQVASESRMLELRGWLLDKLYPELTRKFKFKVTNAEPPDMAAPLGDTRRLHEIARLKVQLREAINRKREPLRSDYLGNDEMRRYKFGLAQSLLENGGNKRDGIDYAPLEAYAAGRGLPLADAVQLIANSYLVSRDLLVQTERIKDQMLARIDAVQTLLDVQALEQEIGALWLPVFPPVPTDSAASVQTNSPPPVAVRSAKANP